MIMERHFVTFFSPGTFVAEATTKPIDSWDVEAAKEMAVSITERYNATPYAFRFTTRSRSDADLDSKVVRNSPTYYLGGKIETLAEVEAREPGSILAGNMRCNGWDRIVTTTKGWKWSQPMEKDDVVLEVTP